MLTTATPAWSSYSGLKVDVYTFTENYEEDLDQADLPVRNATLHSPCQTEGVVTELPDLMIPDVGAGVVLGCQENFVIARITGFISLPVGNYTFTFSGDDGMYLKIGNQVLTNDEEDWILKGMGGSEDVPFTVSSSEPLPLEYWFFEFGGGAFAEVFIRDSQNQLVDQSNLFTYVPAPPAPTSASSDGPVGLRLSESLRTCDGSSWVLSGDRLGSISEIRVAGTAVDFKRVSDEKITFDAPKGLAVGRHKVSFFVGSNLSTELVYSLVFKKEASCSSSLIRLTGLSLGQSQLGPANASELTAQIKSGSSPKRVTCIGSAHSWESENAQKLALQRAEGACKLVRLLSPGVKTQSYGFVGRFMSPNYQAVALRVDR